MDNKNRAYTCPFQTNSCSIPDIFLLFLTDMKKNIPIPDHIRPILQLHLGKEFEQLSYEQQLEGLKKRRSRYWIMILVNAFALVFFSYSFIYGITQLSDIVYYALGTVFVLNVLLIFHQRKQIDVALRYMEAEVR
jgi:hypothetical protein